MKTLFASLSITALFLLAACAQQPTGGITYNTNPPTSVPAASPPAPPVAPAPPDVTPSVRAVDQEISNGQVIVADTLAAAPGWMVIHANKGGAPGPVIGYASINQGDNPAVTVTIDPQQATPTLFAMLHVDAGQQGVYEFPGADVPVTSGGMVVMQSFNVTGLPAPLVPNDVSVTIGGFAFDPSTLTVAKGTRVIWTNNDSVAHTVTGDGWDSQGLVQGASFGHVFNDTGTFAYHCSYHADMVGTVIVV